LRRVHDETGTSCPSKAQNEKIDKPRGKWKKKEIGNLFD
jgi:hypothetical protein